MVKQIALTIQMTDFQQSLAKQIEPNAFQYEELSIAILLISISTHLGEHRILHSSGLYCLKLGKLWLWVSTRSVTESNFIVVDWANFGWGTMRKPSALYTH